MSIAGTIKDGIATLMQTLVTSGDIAVVEVVDVRKDLLDGDVTGFPHVFIQPPAVDASEWIDNRTVMRQYAFNITVANKTEDVADPSLVEDLMEKIMDLLESNVTLNGTADGGITPSTSQPEKYRHGGMSFVVFDIIIRAKAMHTLTS